VPDTHQGWVLDPANQEYLLLDDEQDETNRAGAAADQKATTYIWNIRSLEKPFQTGVYKSKVTSIDHNQYIAKGFSYQSNYGQPIARSLPPLLPSAGGH
jgi:hypothetical protein